MTILAWHFVGETLRDGRPVPSDGEWLEHGGELELCVSGLHASVRLIDALKYAPGNTICRVELDGDVIEDDDKCVARRRRILWRVDSEEVLRQFARRVALDVAHLWDMPAIVREYLETGDELKRATALAAARGAAEAAARNATRNAAWAALTAAWAAVDAVAATWAAVDVTRNAVWAAAWAAVDATRGVAWDAAWAVAWDAAWAAAWAAAWDKYNEWLEKMAEAAR